MAGQVFLVGAGPGSPDLITVRGLRLLQSADSVVHDRLVDSRLVSLARPGAELFDVGKTPGQTGWSQEEINRLLTRLASQGKTVVRLKGGDPFVFGRGGEEIAHLRRAGVSVSVVPGVSSATGVPAALGVPVTHRAAAGEFAVVTGASAESHSEGPHWASLARMDTLVVLMGLGRIVEIAERLMSLGKSPQTPALAVSAGTWPEQRVLSTTLEGLANDPNAGEMPSPFLALIGEVADFWRENGEERPKRKEPDAGADRQSFENLYPLTLTGMARRSVLVVGGGKVGTRKCRLLLKAGARVDLCSPSVTPWLAERIESGEIIWLPRRFVASDLRGRFMAFAATDDPRLNEEIARLAAESAVLCNVATSRNQGDFRVPAVAEMEGCLVAVSTLAGRPGQAQDLRRRLSGFLNVGL